MSSSNQRSISKSSDNLDLDIIYLYSRSRSRSLLGPGIEDNIIFYILFYHTRKYVLDSSIQISSNLRLIKNNIIAISLLVLRIFQKIQLYKIDIEQISCAQQRVFFIIFGSICSPLHPPHFCFCFSSDTINFVLCLSRLIWEPTVNERGSSRVDVLLKTKIASTPLKLHQN